jgi:transposase InsO family protein
MVQKVVVERRADVRLACRILEVSRSGFYAWLRRSVCKRRRINEALIEQMKAIHAESRGTYGSPRITAALRSVGKRCGRNRVARLMKHAGLFGCARRRFRVRTTDSSHDLPIAPRILKTEEPKTLPTRPNEAWVSDITYIPTQEGWLFLTVQLDVFTRKVVGYAMTDHLRAEAVLEALEAAVLGRPQPHAAASGVLVSHSDRGIQYACEAYRSRLAEHGITPSMSRRGNCYDNAYVESFFHTLKVELVHRRRFKTREEAKAALFEYIEVWYNRRRLHSSLGYMSPSEYEAKALAA